jgi:hypothetical protein
MTLTAIAQLNWAIVGFYLQIVIRQKTNVAPIFKGVHTY